MDKELENDDQQTPRKITGISKLFLITTGTAIGLAAFIGGTNRLKLRGAHKHITDRMQHEFWNEAKPLLAAKGSYTLEDLDLDPTLGSRLLIIVLNDRTLNEQEKYDALKKLLQEGAKPNYRDRYNCPVIAYANGECLKLLLKEGCANPDVQNVEGKTLLTRADLSRTEILLEGGANPNIPDELGQTPIFYQTDLKALERLLEYGADPTHKNNDGFTAREMFLELSRLDPSEASLPEICERLEKAEKEWQEKKGPSHTQKINTARQPNQTESGLKRSG